MLLGIFGIIGPMELGLILLIVLIIFGADKLSGVGKALGQSLQEFRAAAGEKDEAQTKNK